MTTAIFDSHGFVKRLTAASMPERQAEVLAEEQSRLLNDQLATKADIAALEADLVALEQRLKDQLTIRLGAMLTVGIVVVATLVKLP